MFKLATPTQFARSTIKRFSRAVCGIILLLPIASPLPAVDLLYVSLLNNTIVIYDTTGNNGAIIAATVSTFANSNLNFPNSLAFDSSGNLFAANYANSTISKFNPAGVFQSTISSNLINPFGLAFDSSGMLYAANIGGSTISKYNSAGVYQGNITSNLFGPMGLAIDSSDNLYAANFNGNSISKFNSFGGFQSTIGSSLNLNDTHGLAIDTSGNIYAANAGNNTISKFNASGGYVSNITSNLNYPVGLAFDSSGNLYAANNNSSISKFDPSGNFLTSWNTGSQPRFLAFQPVPEPSTYALATIATGVMAYLARQRKARNS